MPTHQGVLGADVHQELRACCHGPVCVVVLQVQQAEDRAHRIGQTQSVNVHLLLVRDSIDDLMWELLQNKLATTGQVLDGQAARMEVST